MRSPQGLPAKMDKSIQINISPHSHYCSLNRAVPKFMKRIKVPDYKDRNVFGVPLTVNVQRTGQPLPQSIQQAMRYLRNHCLDQVRPTAHRSHGVVGPRTHASVHNSVVEMLLLS